MLHLAGDLCMIHEGLGASVRLWLIPSLPGAVMWRQGEQTWLCLPAHHRVCGMPLSLLIATSWSCRGRKSFYHHYQGEKNPTKRKSEA